MATVTEDIVETVRLAAKLLTGFLRRRFQAETALKYCGGSARRTEAAFGWGREAVATGLGELRTGIRCQDACHLRGRKKTEALCPAIEAHIHQIVDPQAQADPKFQTPSAFTRITAKAVREALQAVPELGEFVPCRQTVGRILNRLDYRLRRVRKARPEKKFPKPTPSSRTSAKPAAAPRTSRTP